MTVHIASETLAFFAGWVSGIVTVVVFLAVAWRAEKRRSGLR